MGFIMHKYFLSKGLKAPPPSDGKKKKAQRRYSQPGGGTLSEQLSIPEHAYANSSTSKLTKSPGTTARRRRRNSLATTTPSTSASYRRGSMPMLSTTSIAEGSMEDSASMLSGEEQSMNGSMMMEQNSFRRSSLQHSSLYQDRGVRTPQGSQDFSYRDLPEDSMANPYATYYAAVPGDFENPAAATAENEYGYEDAAPHLHHQQQRRYPRRSSASSGISLADETVESEGGVTTSTRRPTRVRQENKWLQLQLDQVSKSCQELESQLYGTRDQLFSTEAMWRKQWHAAEQRHQDEILQVQRQAEQASNAILSQELEALRDAMYQMAQSTSTDKEETKEPDTVVVDVPLKSRGVSSSGDQNVDVSQLQAELQEWKSRHAQVTQDSKHLQETLLQESRDQTALLKESERRIQWLEEELHTATSSQQIQKEEDDLTQVRLVAMLQSHRSQLEDRVEELLVENANLQEEQTKVYAMEGQVQHLKVSLKEARQELEEEKFRNTQQLEQVQTETDDYKAHVANLQEQLSLQAQEATQQEETMRAKYELQIKELQSEKARLQELFHQKEENWNHELNLKNQTIEDLQSKMAVLDLNPSFVDTPPIEEEEGGDIERVFTPSAPEEAKEEDLFQEQPPVSTEDEDFSVSRDLDLDSSFVETPPLNDEEEDEVADKKEIEDDKGDMFEDQPPMSADDDAPLADDNDASQTSFLDTSPLVDEEEDESPVVEEAEAKVKVDDDDDDDDDMFEDQPPMSAGDDVPLAGDDDTSQTSFLDTSPLVDEEEDESPVVEEAEAKVKVDDDEDEDMFEDQPPMSADDDVPLAGDDDTSQTSFLDTSPLVDEEDDDAPEAEPKANEDEDDMFEDQPPMSADGDWSVADDEDASQSSFISTPPLADEREGVVVGEANPKDGDDEDMFQEQPPMSADEDVPLVSADDGDDISFVEESPEIMDQMDDDDDSSHSNDADAAALADKLAVLELREKELSRQIHRISASEAKTKRLLELARKKIHGLESYIEQDDLDDMSRDLAPMKDDESSYSEKEALLSKPMDQTVETEYEDDSLSTQDEEETAAARINPSRDDAHIADKLAAAEQREQELSRQIDLLWARDSKAKRLLEFARKKIQSLESHLEHERERSGNDQTTVR